MKMPYCEVPEEVLSDKFELREWAFTSWETTLKTKKTKKKE